MTAGIQTWVCLGLSLWLQTVQADPPRASEFQLSIQVWHVRDKARQDQPERQPLANMFVYAPNTNDAGARRHLSSNVRVGFKEWLVALADQTSESSAEHVFRIQDGKVVPSRVAGRTIDTWTVPKGGDDGLGIQSFINPPWVGTSATEVSQALEKPEPFPIKIFPIIGNAEAAYALVHG